MACDAAAAIAGLPAPRFPNGYDNPELEPDPNIFIAGELEVELGRFGPNDSLATSFARDDKTSVTGLLSV